MSSGLCVPRSTAVPQSRDLPPVNYAHCSLVQIGLTSGSELRKREKAELLKQEKAPDKQKEEALLLLCNGWCLRPAFD